MDDWEKQLKEEKFWRENYSHAAEWFATAEYEHRNSARRVKNVLIGCVSVGLFAVGFFKGQHFAMGVGFVVVPVTMWLFGWWRRSDVLHLDKELESLVPFQRIGQGSKYRFERYVSSVQHRRGYSPYR